MKKIGVIGLGNMGSAVARNIQRANFPLYVHDIRKDVGKKLIEKGGLFTNTISSIPATKRATSCILTSLHPFKIGSDDDNFFKRIKTYYILKKKSLIYLYYLAIDMKYLFPHILLQRPFPSFPLVQLTDKFTPHNDIL